MSNQEPNYVIVGILIVVLAVTEFVLEQGFDTTISEQIGISPTKTPTIIYTTTPVLMVDSTPTVITSPEIDP